MCCLLWGEPGPGAGAEAWGGGSPEDWQSYWQRKGGYLDESGGISRRWGAAAIGMVVVSLTDGAGVNFLLWGEPGPGAVGRGVGWRPSRGLAVLLAAERRSASTNHGPPRQMWASAISMFRAGEFDQCLLFVQVWDVGRGAECLQGPELSDETEVRVILLFPPSKREEVRRILREECGNNLRFCQDDDSIQLERIRFSVLKLRDGKLDKLRKAAQLAKRDWRDVLMASGFADDVDAHKSWLP